MRNYPLRVGVLGGTFNPAHHGHLMISKQAIKLYKFDYIIWLVANQNPLKTQNKLNIFTFNCLSKRPNRTPAVTEVRQ